MEKYAIEISNTFSLSRESGTWLETKKEIYSKYARNLSVFFPEISSTKFKFCYKIIYIIYIIILIIININIYYIIICKFKLINFVTPRNFIIKKKKMGTNLSNYCASRKIDDRGPRNDQPCFVALLTKTSDRSKLISSHSLTAGNASNLKDKCCLSWRWRRQCNAKLDQTLVE